MPTTLNLPSGRTRFRSATQHPNARASLQEWDVGTVRTVLGWVALVGREGCVYSLAFGHRTADDAIAAAIVKPVADPSLPHQLRSHPWHPTLAGQLVAYAAGQRTSFDDVELDLSHLTRFAARVIHVCRGIEWGETISYGELARRAGSPGAARAVGNVMAANRTPLIVPCHRVVAAHGRLGGFSAPQGTAMKKRLLELEQFRASGTGHMDSVTFPPIQARCLSE